MLTTTEKLKYEWCQEIKPHNEGRKWGHNRKECGKEEKTMDHALMSNETLIQSNKFTKNTWIGDTGATSHMVNSDKGMTDVKIINEHIKMGNGKFMTATKMRNVAMHHQTNGWKE